MKKLRVSWKLWLQMERVDGKGVLQGRRGKRRLLLDFHTAEEAIDMVSKLIDELFALKANRRRPVGWK